MIPKISWINKGNAFKEQSKYDEAIQCYDEAIKLDPNDAKVWNYKGDALYMQDKYDEAIKALDEAIRLDSNDADAWETKGYALEALGWTAGSDAARAKAKDIRLTPKNAEA